MEHHAAFWSRFIDDFAIQFDFTFGGLLKGDRRLQCELTLFGGDIVWDRNGRSGVDWRQLPPGYGVRPDEDLIFPKDP